MSIETTPSPNLVEKNPAKPGNRRAKRTILLLLALLLTCVLLILAGQPILTGIANGLVTVNSPLQKADLIFVLNGDYNTRPFYASELYHQGLAPLILIAQAESSPAEQLGLEENPTSIAVNVMLKQGVPPEAIQVLNEGQPVTSTFDEARVLRTYIETHQVKSVILLTSLFHTRRARWVVAKELNGLPVSLQVAGAPHATFNARNWWSTEDGLIYINNEYIKLFYYWFKYR